MDNSEYYSRGSPSWEPLLCTRMKGISSEIRSRKFMKKKLKARTNQFQIKLIEMHQKIVKQFKETEKVLNFEDVMFGYNRIEN